MDTHTNMVTITASMKIKHNKTMSNMETWYVWAFLHVTFINFIIFTYVIHLLLYNTKKKDKKLMALKRFSHSTANLEVYYKTW